jgi:hypothetical protein
MAGAATWNPAQTHPEITLSGGNLIASMSTATFTNKSTYATNPHTTGKYYAEITIVQSLTNFSGAGIGTTTSSIASGFYIGAGTNSIGYYDDGTLYNSNTIYTSGLATWTTGATIGIALDIDNNKTWWRIAPSGDWDNSPTDNPATNAGGITLPAGVAGSLVFGCSGVQSPDVCTLKPTSASWLGTAPAGFVQP